jgi:DNA-binding CsgD family transcriptional regulator
MEASVARRAFDVLATAQSAKSLAELEASAGAALRAYGFDVVIAVEITRRHGVQGILPIFGDTAAPSIQHYMAQGHAAHCPVIGAASSAPMQWRELKQRPLGPKARQVFHELGEFSMHQGHVVAVHLPARRPIAVSLAGRQSDLGAAADQLAVQLLSVNYGLIGARLAHDEPRPAPRLSARQVEVLKWVREGKSSSDIGDILGLSARTVDDYILTACGRLGVRTRFQAVIEAAQHGLLQL